MYEVDRKVGELYYDHYIYKSKNKSNQIIVFEVFRTIKNDLNVSFYITTKRKDGYQELKITGKDGIKSLVWAKKCLIDFIEFGKQNYKGETLVVYPADDKRRKVYEYELLKIGFKIRRGKDRELYLIL